MLKKLVFFVALSTASVPAIAAQAEAGAPAASSSAAELFGVRESIEDISLSPDGSRIVYVAPGQGKASMAFIADVGGGPSKPILASTGDPERITSCDFAASDRIVCGIYILAEQAGYLIPFTRLISIDTNGQDVKQLGQRRSYNDAYVRQEDGAIIDWLPKEDGVVLMARRYIPEVNRADTRLARKEDGLAVDRINLRTLQATTVEPAERTASSYMTDGNGKVRIMEVPLVEGATGMDAAKVLYHYRRSGSDKWENLGSYDRNTGEGILPLAVDAESDAAYVLKKHNGRDAVFWMALDGSLTSELVYAHDRVDVDNVVRIGSGGRVIGVTFAEEKREIVYFDPEYRALAQTLGRSLSNLPLVYFTDASEDERKLLVFAGSDSDPGRYYLFDRDRKALSELMLVRPQLEKVRLASVKPVTYPAADGSQIPGYLTLPPGSTGKNLPAIVLPHGGPSARDEWGFDWLAQFFASRGYAVLQPNYRGSAGYGDAWLQENGFRSWRTSIGDVNAGGRWLVEQGIADPKRLGIVGWSYGGYAALQSAVLDPDLFKAIVAIAPVTDLKLLTQDWEGFSNQALVADFVGSGPHVKEGSPLQNAERIKAPVLMFHGEWDRNVSVDHAKAMDRQLREAGKKSSLTVYPALEHSLNDSEARQQMLGSIDSFLSKTLGL